MRHGFPLFTAIVRVLVASFYVSILTLIYDASNPLFLQEQKSASKCLISDRERREFGG